tara:strand:+ start:15866 stop:16312 length:447 start_codon:yes stop_codon:yes gene_type:complete
MTVNWQTLDAGMDIATAEQMVSAGEWIGLNTPAATTIALSGDLGYGKTTLSKGIARGWGVTTTVKSPTYNYFLTYKSPRGLLVHLDAYRLSGVHEYDSLMIEDILEDPWLLLIEWPENIRESLPLDTWHLQIESTGENERRLRRVVSA